MHGEALWSVRGSVSKCLNCVISDGQRVLLSDGATTLGMKQGGSLGPTSNRYEARGAFEYEIRM